MAQPDAVHILGENRESTARFLVPAYDDADERRQADRAVAWSAVGLTLTGVIELVVAILTGSVGLLGDALHNLSDVSTSALVFVGFRASKRGPSERFPYGLERAEDLAGIGIAVVIWLSAVLAAYESVRKLFDGGTTDHVGLGMLAALIGIVGNQLVARYKLVVGRRISSGTLVADARHSWLDALSSVGALIGLAGVALGAGWADPVAGLVVTGFIVHVGWEVTRDVAHRLLDGVDDDLLGRLESAAGTVPGVQHTHAKARWTGRTLRVEVEGWVTGQMSVADSDRLGQRVVDAVVTEVPQARSVTWTARSV